MSEPLDLDAIERDARARGYGSAGISPTFERIIALVARVRELEGERAEAFEALGVTPPGVAGSLPALARITVEALKGARTTHERVRELDTRAEKAEARVRELEALLVECHGCLVDSDYGEEPELRELLMRVGRALAESKEEKGR